MSLLADPTAARWAEFEKWVNADPAHLEAYQAIEATWYAMENPGKRLADKEADELSVCLDAMDRAKRHRKTGRRLGTLGTVMAALVAGAIWLERPGLIQDLRADYVTARGERRTVMLADGSSVLLDADSALVDVSAAGERRVRLLRGGVFFEVVPSTIPFVVVAAGGRVEVLGTGFDVRLVADGGSVTLAHGRVSVRTDAHAGATTLEPGQQVNFHLRGAGFIGSGPRSPTPGAPYTYVTTQHFLSAFEMETLRDLPDIEALEDAGLLSRHAFQEELLSREVASEED
ncbi:FecR domain-containing protein [Rhizobium sp. ZW T2_16]|uniref:FecR domain-containing protein n=1 Tax=Rhizobium sp. ZW T2_16 TaxID=3378083 RepID=UPI0038545B91